MAIYEGVVLEHFRRPRNRGSLPTAEAIGDAVNPLCGDAIELFLAIDAGHIAAAAFVADACAICIAAASLVTEAVRGRTVSTALALTTDDVIGWLGVDLPEARHRCAGLPLDALRRALGAPLAGRQANGVIAIVLAAGLASRFGGDKLNALLRGEPLIRRGVRSLAGAVDRIVVVAGTNAPAVHEALAGIDASIVVNDDPAEGLSRSLRTGIAAATDAQAVFIALGDQPHVPPTVPRALLAAWRATHPAILVPRYDGVRGHPVLFDRRMFNEIEQLRGDVGARAVIERDPGRVLLLDVAGPVPHDVDTPSDLAALTAARTDMTSTGLDAGRPVADG